MNEMLLGMKSIKMYSWEPIFEKLIVKARKEEVLYNIRLDYCTILNDLLRLGG